MVRYLATPQSVKEADANADPASYEIYENTRDGSEAKNIDTMYLPLRRRFWPRLIISFFLAVMIFKLLSTIALGELVAGFVISVGGKQTADACPGYNADNVTITKTGLSAHLTLAGTACNSYGHDIPELILSVNYDTAQRLHVKIEDITRIAYQVPKSVFPIPTSNASVSPSTAALDFSYSLRPFNFVVKRKSTNEILFDTSAAPIIFQDQYLRLRTALPREPNLYGLGESTDSFRLNTTDYTRTLWSRDAYGVPGGTNLYGNHPIYFDHRSSGTHGVFLLSSAGMDVKINTTESGDQYLEYNLMSGILDFYFFDGPSPVQVAQQYSEVAGKAAMMPYWGFGFHQCRYGYRDFYAIAEVVYNYSQAAIPLETMWTDIDYMYERYIMTTDPERFPLARVRDYVNYLHEHDQKYVVMVDPAIAYQQKRDNGLPYDTLNRAQEQGILLQKNGNDWEGVVWPGLTVFPDWFHPNTSQYWVDEFREFFDENSGIDIDALWIDMNEAANFNYFGNDPIQNAKDRGFPPSRPALRSSPRQIPGFPIEFQPNASSPYPPDSLGYAPPWLAPAPAPQAKRSIREEHLFSRSGLLHVQQSQSQAELIGFANRNLLEPPYQIENANSKMPYGGPSNNTLDTDIIHYDGHQELDVHNIYGAQMSEFSRNALEARRPNRRPMVITRSTFAGSGRAVGKWLGDNLSTWQQYRQSIQGMLDFAAIYQMPMVGADICGFGGNTTEQLCSRWATLGAFYPFMRNHNGDSSNPQEFYIWESVVTAAKGALDIRYRLLDYIYTAMHAQSTKGTPLLNPLFFIYPNDRNTFGIQTQFFYGPSLLISPVLEEDSTSVEVYLPQDLFYDFKTFAKVQGSGEWTTLIDIPYTDIPIHVKSASIIPMRTTSAMTTTALRNQTFTLLIAPTSSDAATGSLYLDDGDSIIQTATSEITFTYQDKRLLIDGTFAYQNEKNMLHDIVVLGVEAAPNKGAYWGKGNEDPIYDTSFRWDAAKQALWIVLDLSLDKKIVVTFE